MDLSSGIASRNIMGEERSIETVDAAFNGTDLVFVEERPSLGKLVWTVDRIGNGIGVHRAPRNETARRPTFVAADGLFNSAEKKSLSEQ
jgi:hypothetical protein